jgi:hypothetical protein
MNPQKAEREFDACEFEADALAAALQSRWPHGVDTELRAHIETCTICTDVVTVAGAIDEAHGDLRAGAMVPDSGRVWWLAQLRARREAAEAAGRPITAAQVIAFACLTAVLGAWFGATSTWFQSTLGRVESLVAGIDGKSLLHAATAHLGEHGLLALAMGVVLLVVPTAVYFALGKD